MRSISMSNRRKLTILGYSIALLLTIIALQLTLLMLPLMKTTPFLFFIGAIALSAWSGGLGPTLVATFMAIILVDWFIIDPGSFSVTPIEFMQFAMFALVACLNRRRIRRVPRWKCCCTA
jgi:K+-sensing histidine kinase KdpD